MARHGKELTTEQKKNASIVITPRVFELQNSGIYWN